MALKEARDRVTKGIEDNVGKLRDIASDEERLALEATLIEETFKPAGIRKVSQAQFEPEP